MKINFNTPLINENGLPVMRMKTHKDKYKINQNGQPTPELVLDAEGQPVQEEVMVREVLVQVLNHAHDGDSLIDFSKRAKRGKLARKISTSSTANYRTEDLQTIQELSAKVGSTALLAQLDDLINGVDESEAPESAEAKSGEQAA